MAIEITVRVTTDDEGVTAEIENEPAELQAQNIRVVRKASWPWLKDENSGSLYTEAYATEICRILAGTNWRQFTWSLVDERGHRIWDAP